MSDTPEFKSREEWLEGASTTEGKKAIVEALKAYKISATEYLGKQWSVEKRVDVIMEHQEKAGYGGGEKKKGGKKAAEVTAAPAATKTAAPAATASATPAAGSATALILQQLTELGERLTALEAGVKDTHYLARTLVVSGDLLELAEGDDWKATHYNTLVVEGDAEGNE